MTGAGPDAPDDAAGTAAAPPPVAGLVIAVEPRRIPGDWIVRPWLCIVSCPGKRDETTSRRFTRAAACRAGERVARHLASGRPFRVVWR